MLASSAQDFSPQELPVLVVQHFLLLWKHAVQGPLPYGWHLKQFDSVSVPFTKGIANQVPNGGGRERKIEREREREASAIEVVRMEGNRRQEKK